MMGKTEMQIELLRGGSVCWRLIVARLEAEGAKVTRK